MLGVASLVGGCSIGVSGIRFDDSSPPAPPRTPDDDAREAAVAGVTLVLVGCRDIAGRPGMPGPVVAAAERAVSACEVQVSALGPLPGVAGSPAASTNGTAPTVSRVLSSGRTTAADALADVPLISGPLARLLACVAAGLMVTTQSLAAAARRTPVTLPRSSAADLPALVNDDILSRLRDATAGRILPEPPGSDAIAALRAMSVSLRTAEYGYGLASARLSGADRSYALSRSDFHRRAALSLDALGQSISTPMPVADPAYPVIPPKTAAASRTLGRALELDCAFAASRLVADLSTTFPLGRGLFADHVVSSALGAADWGVVPAMPGMSAG